MKLTYEQIKSLNHYYYFMQCPNMNQIQTILFMIYIFSFEFCQLLHERFQKADLLNYMDNINDIIEIQGNFEINKNNHDSINKKITNAEMYSINYYTKYYLYMHQQLQNLSALAFKQEETLRRLHFIQTISHNPILTFIYEQIRTFQKNLSQLSNRIDKVETKLFSDESSSMEKNHFEFNQKCQTTLRILETKIAKIEASVNPQQRIPIMQKNFGDQIRKQTQLVNTNINSILAKFQYFEEMQKKVNQLKMDMPMLSEKIKASIFLQIKNNGLQIGQRWRIYEWVSGDYSALVFRDFITTKQGKDCRIAMWKNKYVDI